MTRWLLPAAGSARPTVSAEKLPSGQEALLGLRKLEALLGRRVDAVFPIEIGGSNGLAPILLAMRAGVPVSRLRWHGARISRIADGHLQRQRDLSASPAVLTDDKGNCVTIEAADNVSEERIARAVSTVLGASLPPDGISAERQPGKGLCAAAVRCRMR